MMNVLLFATINIIINKAIHSFLIIHYTFPYYKRDTVLSCSTAN